MEESSHEASPDVDVLEEHDGGLHVDLILEISSEVLSEVMKEDSS